MDRANRSSTLSLILLLLGTAALAVSTWGLGLGYHTAAVGLLLLVAWAAYVERRQKRP